MCAEEKRIRKISVDGRLEGRKELVGNKNGRLFTVAPLKNENNQNWKNCKQIIHNLKSS